jgi:uncharacterized integral membrane protein
VNAGHPAPLQVIIVVAVVAGVVLTLAVLASASRRDDQDGQSRLP